MRWMSSKRSRECLHACVAVMDEQIGWVCGVRVMLTIHVISAIDSDITNGCTQWGSNKDLRYYYYPVHSFTYAQIDLATVL